MWILTFVITASARSTKFFNEHFILDSVKKQMDSYIYTNIMPSSNIYADITVHCYFPLFIFILIISKFLIHNKTIFSLKLIAFIGVTAVNIYRLKLFERLKLLFDYIKINKCIVIIKIIKKHLCFEQSKFEIEILL